MSRRPNEKLGDWLSRMAKERAKSAKKNGTAGGSSAGDEPAVPGLAIGVVLGIIFLLIAAALQFRCVHAQTAAEPCGYGAAWHTQDGGIVCDLPEAP